MGTPLLERTSHAGSEDAAASFWTSRGSPDSLRELRGDQPLTLDPNRVWVVCAGRVDVFAIPNGDGALGRRRTHLFRVASGGPVIGAHQAGGLALLGVGAPGTRVIEIDPHVLERLAAGSSTRVHAARLIERWVGHLYECLAVYSRMPTHKVLDLGVTLDVPSGVCVRPEPPIAWLEQVSGSSHLGGRRDLRILAGALLPITNGFWVTTTEDSSLRLVTTEEVLTRGAAAYRTAGHAVAQLQIRVLSAVAGRLKDAAKAERERSARQRQARSDAVESSIARLASILHARNGEAPLIRTRAPGPDETAAGSVFPAFRIVANAQGIELGDPHRSHQTLVVKEAVQNLARSYRLRARRVALRGEWWTSDGEPLLARRAEGGRTVALLPSRAGYRLVDPYEGAEMPVTSEIAAALQPFAHTLYRPFAAEPLRPRDLLDFGLFGCRRDLLTVGLAGAAMAALGLVTPLVTASLFNEVIPGAERGQLLQLVLGLLVAAAAVTAFQLVRGTALLRIESRVGPRLQAAVWDRLLTLPLPFFRKHTAGELALRAMGIEEMRSIASGTVVTAILSGLFSLSNIGLLFYYSARLAWIATLLILVAVLVSVAISYLQLKSQRSMVGLRSKSSGLVLQLLTGIAKLRIAGAEVHGFALWSRLFSEQRRLSFRTRTLKNVQATFTAVFPLLCTLTIFAMALPFVADAGEGGAAAGDAGARAASAAAEALTTGDFLGFLAAFTGALGSTLSASGAVVGALAMVPIYEQLKPIVQTRPEVDAGKQDPGDLSGAIALHRVTFRYNPGGPAALQDVSVYAKPGEFVALVGPSGSGKSTALRLLLGFEAAESGRVTYDDQDLSGLDLEAVRRQIGVVMQSGRVMAGDVFSNIVGSSNATLDDAWNAARMAGLDEDIEQMPMSMHTVISEGGNTLSGGQRQRLMIARALVKRPRILLFDEATSALDNRTQDIVNRSLERLKVTRVVIAHRLTTIRNADRIYVIRAGSVVETGTYDELMAHGGVFAELARRQLA